MQESIFETFILPSKGMVYDKPIPAQVCLRSMTTLEEMKRLSHSDTPYKVMADIIEDCMKEKPAIHVYEMCIGDYQFLLHKLRVVTYGTKYKMAAQCPKCGQIVDVVCDLDSLAVNEYDEQKISNKEIVLPVSNARIRLRFQTPKDIDDISYKTKELQKKTKQNIDYSLLFTVASVIEQVDGKRLNSIQLEEFVKGLPMKDINTILVAADNLSKEIGVDTMITAKCGSCGSEIVVPFRLTSEFFGPTED